MDSVGWLGTLGRRGLFWWRVGLFRKAWGVTCAEKAVEKGLVLDSVGWLGTLGRRAVDCDWYRDLRGIP